MEQIGEEQKNIEDENNNQREVEPQSEPKIEQVNKSQSAKANVDDTLKKLNVMFSYYASYGDRLNVTNLKSSKYHKLMQDAGIECSIVQKKRIDLIFCSENKNKPNMNFNTFLDTLPQIAQLKYPEMSPGDALNELVQQILLPLYENLIDNQVQIPNEERYDIELTESAGIILKSIEETLFDIYVTYFPWEQKTSDELSIVKNRSNRATFSFLNEFEVCPAMLSKTIVFNILMSVLNNPNPPPTANLFAPNHNSIGTVFTFAKFAYTLVKVAFFAYENPVVLSATSKSRVSYSTAERLCMLLERMELSDGFVNLEKKTNRPHMARTSLLPPETIIAKVRRYYLFFV